MLVIRFLRVGKKGQPSFKIVVTDKRKPPRAGRFVEEVGFYNPLTKEKVLRQDKIKHWLSKGAKPSDTVHNLLIGEKVIEGKKISKHIIVKKTEEISEVAPATEPKEEAPVVATEAAPVEVVAPSTAKAMTGKEEEVPVAEKATEESQEKAE